MSDAIEGLSMADTRPVRGRGGRPRLYATPAAKQKAYRQRVRAKAAAYDALSRQAAEHPVPDPRDGKPQTGPELFAALVANGFIGALADRDDIGDSVEYARKLRERAWTRQHE
jgi:hypothetical protein